MNRKPPLGVAGVVLVIALALASAIAGGAFAAGDRASGRLQLNARFTVPNDLVTCPAGIPERVGCYLFFIDEAVVPGLGRVTTRYMRTFDGNLVKPCVRTLPTAVITVAGKGEIDASITGAECLALPPVGISFGYAISGGSGAYAGASGSIQVKSLVPTTGPATDAWSGTLTVPGLDFDLTAPTFTGATSKVVKAPKGAKRARVRYTVKAQDAVDGSVPAACMPRSGSFFNLGRTKVNCSATDSSANTKNAQFSIIVKR